MTCASVEHAGLRERAAVSSETAAFGLLVRVVARSMFWFCYYSKCAPVLNEKKKYSAATKGFVIIVDQKHMTFNFYYYLETLHPCSLIVFTLFVPNRLGGTPKHNFKLTVAK